jgi:CTP synthase
MCGVSPDNLLVEMIELKDHPWFVATQFHPEFQSRPQRAQPLFKAFIKAALEHHRRVEDLSPGRVEERVTKVAK